MTKRIIAVICVVALAAVALVGCNMFGSGTISIPEVPDNGSSAAASDSDEITTATDATVNSADADSFDGKKVAGAMEVTSEIYNTDYSHVLYLFITNKSGVDCDIDINVDFFDKDGNIVGTTTGYIDAFADGTTVAENFYCDDPFEKFEYQISASELSYYIPIDKDLKLEINIATNKAIVSVTNNGTQVARYVEYLAFFYKDGKLVETDWGYCDDSDSEIKPGATQRDEAHCYEDFDDVKVYIHGEAYSNDD